MTYKERLSIEYPECINDIYIGGCCGCPGEYNYSLKSHDNCGMEPNDENCKKCWNSTEESEGKKMEFKVGDKVRIKGNSSRKGWDIYGEMNRWIGKVMTINEFVGDSVLMEEDQQENRGHGWLWNIEDLEKVEVWQEGKKKFTIVDLKDGMLCQMRDGEKMLWLYGRMRGISRMCSGTRNDLKHTFRDNCDIVKVGYPNLKANTIEKMLSMDFGEVIWQEEKVSKDITIEEINALLKEKYPDVDIFNLPIKDGECK